MQVTVIAGSSVDDITGGPTTTIDGDDGPTTTIDDDDGPTGPSNAPASHTVSQDGVRHLPGLNDPETNCVTTADTETSLSAHVCARTTDRCSISSTH